QVTGTQVGVLSTTDPDAGDTFTYTLVSGTGSTDNAGFQIVGSTLQNTLTFDFVTQTTPAIHRRSAEAGKLVVEEQFTVTVTNVNEAPTDIGLNNATVAENQAGSHVGDLSTVDPDAGDTFTYTLVAGIGSTDNGSFQIVNGNELKTLSGLDFETTPTA